MREESRKREDRSSWGSNKSRKETKRIGKSKRKTIRIKNDLDIQLF